MSTTEGAPAVDPERARRVGARVVVVVAAVACVATQAPRWSLEAAVPKAAPPPSGKALRVTVEASQEPSLHGKGGGAAPTWEDRTAPRPGWPGRADLFVDDVPTGATITDRCTSGGGMCSSCDPPPGAFVRVVGVSEVDIWRTSTTTVVPAGAGTRIDVEVESTRPPRVDATGASATGSCWVSSPAASPAPAPTVAPASASASASATVPAPAPAGAVAAPTPAGARREVFSCWVEGPATISVTIRGACTSGPCPAPAGEAVSIVRATRVP